MSSDGGTPADGAPAEVAPLEGGVDVSGAGWPEPLEATGEPEIDAALDVLDDVAERPLGGHVDIFEDVHARLRAALEASEHLEPHADGSLEEDA